MPVTAFPVLARILGDRGLMETRIGALALACAAVGDVLAWTLLAVVAVLAGRAVPLWHVLFAVPIARSGRYFRWNGSWVVQYP